MIIPADWFGRGFVAALLVPGMAHGGANRFLWSYRSHHKSVASSVLRALLVSSVFDAFYFTAFGFFALPLLADPVAVITAGPAAAEAIFGFLVLLVPTVVALTVHKVGCIDPLKVNGRWRLLVKRAASRSRGVVSTAREWSLSGRR